MLVSQFISRWPSRQVVSWVLTLVASRRSLSGHAAIHSEISQGTCSFTLSRILAALANSLDKLLKLRPIPESLKLLGSAME
jgi:hypothetical protein